jgi:hypothetical protein
MPRVFSMIASGVSWAVSIHAALSAAASTSFIIVEIRNAVLSSNCVALTIEACLTYVLVILKTKVAKTRKTTAATSMIDSPNFNESLLWMNVRILFMRSWGLEDAPSAAN